LNRVLIAVAALLASVAIWASAESLDASRLVGGKWKLEGKQTNHIGTAEEHEYDYFYTRTWALLDGRLYVNGNEYTETKVSGDVVEASYRRDDQWKTIRIRFLARDTVEYTEEGRNDAFGSFSVSARGTRMK